MKKLFYILIPAIIIFFGTACQSTGSKEGENLQDTKNVKTEAMQTLSKKQFIEINKIRSVPGDGWELIYYSREKILVSNVRSLIMLRRQKDGFQVDKILDLKHYNLNHAQAEEATEILPSNNGEQVLLYNSYDSENSVLSEDNENLESWVANFVTGTMKKYKGNDLKKIAKEENGSFFSCLYICKPAKVPKIYEKISRSKYEITAFSTAYNDEKIVLITRTGNNNMLSLTVERYKNSAKKTEILYTFTGHLK